MSTAVRLNKYLAEQLGISRREADDLIAAGRILVNGQVAKLGQRVSVNFPTENNENPSKNPKNSRRSITSIDKFDEVCYNGDIGALANVRRAHAFRVQKDGHIIISPEVRRVYLAMNKPAGYVCSRRRQGESPTIYELLPKKYQELKTVGRLDKDSSGLILLTNDGDFAFQMTHPKFTKTKVYEVELDKALEPLHQQLIADFGIEIGDGVSRLGLERLDDSRKSWRVTMAEGRNRQIRRTFGALGYTVTALHRTDFGRYRLDGLQSGGFAEIKNSP